MILGFLQCMRKIKLRQPAYSSVLSQNKINSKLRSNSVPGHDPRVRLVDNQMAIEMVFTVIVNSRFLQRPQKWSRGN